MGNRGLTFVRFRKIKQQDAEFNSEGTSTTFVYKWKLVQDPMKSILD